MSLGAIGVACQKGKVGRLKEWLDASNAPEDVLNHKQNVTKFPVNIKFALKRIRSRPVALFFFLGQGSLRTVQGVRLAMRASLCALPVGLLLLASVAFGVASPDTSCGLVRSRLPPAETAVSTAGADCRMAPQAVKATCVAFGEDSQPCQVLRKHHDDECVMLLGEDQGKAAESVNKSVVNDSAGNSTKTDLHETIKLANSVYDQAQKMCKCQAQAMTDVTQAAISSKKKVKTIAAATEPQRTRYVMRETGTAVAIGSPSI